MSKKTFIFLVSGLIIALGFFVVQAAGPSLESSKNLTVPAASTIIFQGTTPTSINWSSYGGYSLTAGLATNASACTGDSNCDMPGSGIWNSSGNVGIGDTSPNEKLDVAGNIQAGMETSNTANIKLDIANAGSPQFSISDTNGDNYWALGADDADNSFKILGSASAMPTINNLTTPFFTITTAGNVGIGTTVPLGDAGDLTLGSTAGTQGRLFLYGSTAGVHSEIMTTNGNLHIDSNSAANGIYLNYYGGTGGVFFGNGASGSNASVSAAGTVTAAQFVGGGAGITGVTGTDSTKVAKAGDTMTDTLTINNSAEGKVLLSLYGADSDKWIGFGGHGLHIGTSGYGHNVIYLGPKGSTSGYLTNDVYFNWADATATRYNRWAITAAPASGAIFGYANNGSTVNTLINSTGDSYFNIGNVGIGTASPDAKLNVVGNAIVEASSVSWSEGLSVDSANGVWGGIKWRTVGRSGNTGNWHLGYNASHSTTINSNLYLYNGAGLYPMTWDYDTGNVGIGTTNPGYKLDVAGNMRVASGDNSYTYYGPNSSWGGQLYVGATPGKATTNTSSVVATDGNLHLDSGTNKDMYLNYYASGRPIHVYGPMDSNSTITAPTFNIGSITGDGMIENNYGAYLHIGGWGVGKTAATAVLVNTAYMADYATNATNAGSASNVTGGSISGNMVASNYGIGIMGVYSDVRYQAVWSMGTSWLLPADGTTPGNLYGLAWTHSNIGGQSKAGLSHQLLVMENGVTKVALGSGIWTSGSVTAASFIYGSDRNLKKNIATIGNPLDKIMQLRGVTFDWKKDNTPSVGLIAQEVEKVFPELVSGEEGNKGIQYGNLVAPLIEAVKEQQRKIDQLETRIIILEMRK